MTATSPAPRDVLRWSILTPLLSLDVVIPFYVLMGIRLDRPGDLASLLRREILATRAEGLAKPEKSPLVSPQRIIEAIGRTLGRAAQAHLVWWEERIFHEDPRDNLELNYWDDVLRACRHQDDLWYRLAFPEPIRAEARERFVAAIDSDEYQRRFVEVYAKPLSDWDLHMYAVNLYDDDDSEGTPSGPDTFVRPTARDYRGYRYWAWVLSHVRGEQLDRLWQSAQQIIRDTEYLQYIRELPHPGVLDIGL